MDFLCLAYAPLRYYLDKSYREKTDKDFYEDKKNNPGFYQKNKEVREYFEMPDISKNELKRSQMTSEEIRTHTEKAFKEFADKFRKIDKWKGFLIFRHI